MFSEGCLVGNLYFRLLFFLRKKNYKAFKRTDCMDPGAAPAGSTQIKLSEPKSSWTF